MFKKIDKMMKSGRLTKVVKKFIKNDKKAKRTRK